MRGQEPTYYFLVSVQLISFVFDDGTLVKKDVDQSKVFPININRFEAAERFKKKNFYVKASYSM